MKKTSKIKRIVSIVLIFLLSINNYAAIVSDNDGSAFITKAEFDALKAGFAQQIDDYNNSIDGKIDGAISSYLSGIKMNKALVDYWQRVSSAVGGALMFYNSFASTGSSEINTAYNIEYRNQYNKLTYDPENTFCRAQRGGYLLIYSTAVTAAQVLGDSTKCILGSGGNNAVATTFIPTGWVRENGTKLTECAKSYKRGTLVQNNNISGSGSLWEYVKNPTGTLSLYKFYTTYYPKVDFSISGHVSQNYVTASVSEFKDMYCSSTGQNYSDERVVSQSASKKIVSFGSLNEGTVLPVDSESIGTWYSANTSKVAISDGVDYSLVQFGKNTNMNLNFVADNPTLISDSALTTGTSDTFILPGTYYTPVGSSSASWQYAPISFKYYKTKIIPEHNSANTFVNSYLTNLVGEHVYLGGGTPFVENPNSDAIDMRLNCKILDYDTTGSASTGSVTIIISDKQFVDGGVAPGATLIFSDTVNVSDSSGVLKTYDITLDKQGLFWLNMYSNTTGHICTLTDVSIA